MTSEHKEEITLESKDDEELESSDLNLDEIEWAASPSSIDGEFKLNTSIHRATSFLGVKDLA